MSTDQRQTAIRDDYLKWSGGDPPDDDRDVFLYVEYAREDEDEKLVYEVLRDWMESL